MNWLVEEGFLRGLRQDSIQLIRSGSVVEKNKAYCSEEAFAFIVKMLDDLKKQKKIVEAARKALVEIVGRDGTMSHYVQLGVVERIAREALKAMKELDGEK